MKRYAELAGNRKNRRIKSQRDNILDYTGEIIVALHNDTNEFQTIQDGERIAQIVITQFLPVEFNEVEELRETERGGGGFGSTGEK